jgi:Flp pilus assembly protein TadG
MLLSLNQAHRMLQHVASDATAASLVEFAVALPLLMVLVVGIFDFGGAFNTKQELNNAVREGARLGASLPTNDLGNSSPPNPGTVDAVRFLVSSYLAAAGINDCGLGVPALAANAQAVPNSWQYSAQALPCTAANPLLLNVIRGFPSCSLAANNYGTNGFTTNIPCTQVSIVYPYQWHFNSVIGLLVPGSSYGPFINIATDATSPNVD